MIRQLFIATLFLLGASPALAQQSDPLYVVDHYDAGRDPGMDLRAAEAVATAQHKRILLEVGGTWCSWCALLDHFIASDAEVHAELAQSFVIVKVNYSPQNENREFLSSYRESPGYPDFIILDSNGRFRSVQNTEKLEQGDSYNRDAMIAFARAWRQ